MKQKSTVVSLNGKTPESITEEINKILEGGNYIDMKISPQSDYIVIIVEPFKYRK